MLDELLEAYRAGRTDVQQELLDEVEPLFFGFLHSLIPSAPDARERAIAFANALTLAFHLRACAGSLALPDIGALRGFAHRSALEKLRDPDPLRLRPLGDPETGSMVDRCIGLGLTLESELTDGEREALTARLEGTAPADPNAWQTASTKLAALGLLES